MPLVDEIIQSGSRIGIWRIDGTEREQLSKRPDAIESVSVKHPRTQLQRIASRLLLAEMAGMSPRLEKDEFGKPILPDMSWDISISHTEGYAVIMLGNGKLGVDIQHYKPNVMKVRDRFLDQRELGMAKDIETTTLFWAAKEAIYKYNAKPGLDFRGPISIHSFETDSMQGSFIYNNRRTELTLGWKKLEEAVLVWTA